MPEAYGQDKTGGAARVARVNLKVLAEISKFAAVEDHRGCLRGVHVEIDPLGVTYVATDGRRLIAHRVPVVGDGVNSLTGAFTIPTAQCRAFKAPNEFEAAWGELTWSSKTLTVRFWDVALSFYPITDAFPSWRLVVPSGYASGVAGQFSAEQFASFGKFAAALDLSAPYIRHDGEGNAARILFQNSPDTIGVLTALKVNSPAWPTPVWVENRPYEATPDPAVANARAEFENTDDFAGLFDLAQDVVRDAAPPEPASGGIPLDEAERRFEAANAEAAAREAAGPKRRGRKSKPASEAAGPKLSDADRSALYNRGMLAFRERQPGMVPDDLAGTLGAECWLTGWGDESRASARRKDAAAGAPDTPDLPAAPERELADA